MKTTLARLIERIQGTFYDRHTDLNAMILEKPCGSFSDSWNME